MKAILMSVILIVMSGSVNAQEALKPSEKDVATRVVQSPGGTLVRIIGVPNKPSDSVKDSVLGRIVEINNAEIPQDSLCHVILDAPVLKPGEGANVSPYEMPDIPELEYYFYEGNLPRPSRPIKLSGSKNIMNYFRWSVLFQGGMCTYVADLSNYVSSTMAELYNESPVDKARTLRTRGTCDCDGSPCACDVPFGDPRANNRASLVVHHRWANRDDLNFMELKWNDATGSYQTDRTTVMMEKSGIEKSIEP